MTPTSKYFSPRELIQPSLFEHLTVSALMACIGTGTLYNLDKLRADYEGAVRAMERYKSNQDKYITINGNYFGTVFKYSGLRSANCPIGAEHSAHKEGKTFDLKCLHMDILLNLVLENYKDYSITRIENPDITVPRGWLHVQFTTMQPVEKLIIFDP